MTWGCECGLGWYDILSSLCWMLNKHEENISERIAIRNKYQKPNDESDLNYESVKFDQIKEKFGGLRIYHSGGDDYIDGLIGMAESFSYKICEVCGERGKPNKGGWIVTLCDKCRNKQYDQTTNNNAGV
jgi:NADH pyrophosphatase NudC (nudix superfamily)